MSKNQTDKPVPLTSTAALDFCRDWAAAATVGLEARAVRAERLSQGWGELQADRSIVGQPIRLAGQTFEHGLGTHADSRIRLRAGQPIRRLRAVAGLDDNPACRRGNEDMGNPARLVFSVTADGRELWRSPALGINSPPACLDVAADGVRELILEARDITGRALNYGHADWADLELELADGTRTRPAAGAFAAQWLPDGVPPFAFTYGGRPVVELLPQWNVTRSAAGDAARTVAWRDPGTGLECRLEQQLFPGYPAVEWVLRLKNTGTQDTPLIEDIQPLAMDWHAAGEAHLRRSVGSPCRPDDFNYRIDALPRGETIRMAAGGGRSSNAWLPFFNLQTAATGVILAIGWTGQWAAEFARDAQGRIALRAGQELTRLVLRPGEEIRTPRILLLFWEGEPQASHNLLRRFILEHHTPHPGGKPLEGPLTVAHWGGMKTHEHLSRIEAYRRQHLDYEYYWIDAGWYGTTDSYSPDEFTGDWFKHVGNWSINPAAHPEGLRPISDAAAKAGMKFLLWFEPERAVGGTPLTREHPEWFLGENKPGASLLFDLGNPEARQWMTEYITTFMKRQGVRLYRQDFNFDPLPYWRAADAPDRQGMAEIRHVEGLYEFWDAILASQPGMIIDNCASGGRRIDLETISRSIPLWRSDWQCGWEHDPTPGQTHTMGLSYWVPLSGTGVLGAARRAGDTYNFRSNLSAAIQFGIYPYESFPIRDDYPWDWHRRMLAEYRRARPLFRGDYYPLTPCSDANDAWAVFQFHRPDLGEGMLLAFRRPASPFISADFRLQALNPDAEYELEDADAGTRRRVGGGELINQGVRLIMDRAPASRLVFYRSIR
jgi:alpha-galactosidase